VTYYGKLLLTGSGKPEHYNVYLTHSHTLTHTHAQTHTHKHTSVPAQVSIKMRWIVIGALLIALAFAQRQLPIITYQREKREC